MIDLHAQWIASMRAGRYDEAWTIARHVLDGRDPGSRDDADLPYHQRWVWDGSPVAGRRVVVRCYHGLGDTLQFARFLPLLARRAASVTLEVQRPLVDLIRAAGWPIEVVAFDEQHPIPCGEVDVEITELDFALRTPPELAPPPYLNAPRAILPPGTIAICHRAGGWDGERSVPEHFFAPVCALASCITLVAAPSELDVLNRQGCPLDMGATAALVAEASLVITVDTMIAHLAGALRKPTWLLLKARPDWRWPAEGGSSAWYPHMKLYRQPRAGDWETVMARVTRDLSACNTLDARSFT